MEQELYKQHISDAQELYKFLNYCISKKASDIVLQSGYPIQGFVHGETVQFTSYVMQSGQIDSILRLITAQDIGSRLTQAKDYDHAFDIPDASQRDRFGEPVRQRFRMNATACHSTQGGAGYQVVLRHIPSDPPTLDAIGFPESLIQEIGLQQGAFLIAGETGSGKTTTFAACLRHILEDNTHIEGNILTYESPIEYVLGGVESKRCLVAQAEIGKHIGSFAAGIRNAMRRKPSLIVVGELRDEETIGAAVEAATTGHPIYATTHARSAELVIRRMVQRFPERLQSQAFHDIVQLSRIVMSQTLVPRKGGGRVCLRDWIVISPERAEKLLGNRDHHVRVMTDIMEAGDGGRSMDESIRIAWEAGELDEDVALLVLKRYGYKADRLTRAAA